VKNISNHEMAENQRRKRNKAAWHIISDSKWRREAAGNDREK